MKKHWYKVGGRSRTAIDQPSHSSQDMHYAEFAADEVSSPPKTILVAYGSLMLTKSVQEAALLAAIKEYEANKWKEIGKKVGKPAKVCSTSSPLHTTSEEMKADSGVGL